MVKSTYAERLLLEGIALVGEVMKLREIPEDLRVKLAKWRMAVEAVTDNIDK